MNMSPTYYVCGSKIECERARAKENEWCTIERKQKWPIPDSFQKISTDYICVFFFSLSLWMLLLLFDWSTVVDVHVWVKHRLAHLKVFATHVSFFESSKMRFFYLVSYTRLLARAPSLSLLYWTISVADANATKSVSFAADGKKRERKWRRVGMKWNVWRRFQRAISFEI